MNEFIEKSIAQLKAQIGDGRALCALSGGVDSSVSCALVSKAIGKNLFCVFVDHGYMRKNEADEVELAFSGFDINFIRVNAEQRFLDKTKGVTDPEKKRKIIGEEFIRVFEEEAHKIGNIKFLVQGTIYPDIVESGSDGKNVVKSHHNVGGLPEKMDLTLVEPIRQLYKDDVRKVGELLGLPSELTQRQPFPGPGLAVRCIGELTKEKLDILREADYIFRNELEKAGLNKELRQYFAILTDMRSVGVTNDKRTYDYTIALRAIKTTDFMTAQAANIPYDVLSIVSKRIASQVKNVNRIVYDITDKPPATIEWE